MTDQANEARQDHDMDTWKRLAFIGNIMEMQFLKKFDVEKWERRKRAIPS